MTNIWSYVCEKDEYDKIRYYITSTKPELIFRDEEGYWDTDEDCWWYEVDPDLKKVSRTADIDMIDLKTSGAALMLDLSDIPLPTETDTKPIVVVQKIVQSIDYYTEE